MNLIEWVDVHFLLSGLLGSCECSDNQIIVDIIRKCGVWGGEELFTSYEGSSSTKSVFSQNGCIVQDRCICMSPVNHMIVMEDLYGNG